tara:strand:- start:88118 stop:88474 length:357 start_codon:yes stop_codon:yes gene_type:complete
MIINRGTLIGFAQSILGWTFIIIGIIGIFLPLLQGVLFILIGLTLLSTRNALARRTLIRLEKKYPETYAKVNNFQYKVIQNRYLLALTTIIILGILAVGFYLGIRGFLKIYSLFLNPN